MIQANIAIVKIGNVEIEGLMDEHGTYYVAMPQIADEFSIPIKHASRDLKTLLGKDSSFPIVKLKTPLHSQSVNAVSIEAFEKIMFELALKGNDGAIKMSRALIGLSLHQLFSDSFGVKFEADDRQRWLQCRFKTKHDFRPLTDQLQKYGFKEPWEYANFISAMQTKIGVVNGTRDFLDYSTLNRLERCQDRITTYMECGYKPYDALAKVNLKTL